MFRMSNNTRSSEQEHWGEFLRRAWALLRAPWTTVLASGDVQRIITVLRLILDFMEFVLRARQMWQTAASL